MQSVCVTNARKGRAVRAAKAYHLGTGSTSSVSHSCPIFTSFRDFDYRDGNLGLAGPGLRPETAGKGLRRQQNGY